jgi:two-component system phosphate regulon sensor histidine kinase PhoR
MLRSRIGDILMLGSLRTITTDPDTRNEHAPLHSVLQSVIDETGGLRRQHNVTVALIGLNPVVYGDLGQLKVLFANLISNAITYSRDDCRVEVAVSAGPPLMVRISDQGIGIAADALPHIFEDFYRSRNAAKYNVKSTGLGLAIVRQIASNLGLILKVESEEGEGTTFKVEFPPAMLEERDPGHRKMAGDQSR